MLYVHVKGRSGGRGNTEIDKINMASPRTRRVLKEIKPKDGNGVSKIDIGCQIHKLSSYFRQGYDDFLRF